MIYSENIEKRCGLCRFSKPENPESPTAEDICFCEKKKKSMPQSCEACKKFSYDILKKPVRRKRRLSAGFKAEDFSL